MTSQKMIIMGVGCALLVVVGFGVFKTFSDRLVDTGTPQCLIYGVYERKISGAAREENTGFFSIDPKTLAIRDIGPLHQDAEFQGIDLHPTRGLLYTNTSNNGLLQTVHPQTGSLREISAIPYNKISAFAYHPLDGSLWGWSEKQGLVKINSDTAEATMQFESTREVESIAWDDRGTRLYLAIGESTDLYAYDPAAKTIEKISDTILQHTAGLTTLQNGLLLGSALIEDAHILSLYVYDPAKKQVTSQRTVETVYDSVEGITWPVSCGIPL